MASKDKYIKEQPMRSEDETKKDCTNCLYFDIETFYGVCNKHGVILSDEKPCEDFEEDNQ